MKVDPHAVFAQSKAIVAAMRELHEKVKETSQQLLPQATAAWKAAGTEAEKLKMLRDFDIYFNFFTDKPPESKLPKLSYTGVISVTSQGNVTAQFMIEEEGKLHMKENLVPESVLVRLGLLATEAA